MGFLSSEGIGSRMRVMPDANDLTSASYWDKWWNRDAPLDPPIRSHWTEIGANGYFLRAVERYTGSLTGKSVVELGGALSNRLLAMAKWRNVQATAIDYSRVGLASSQKMFENNGCSIELICGDFFDRSLTAKQFDVVTHWGVLEHQIDPQPLIRRSIELAKPGGHVIFTMPQMLGPGAWLWRHWSPESWKLHILHRDDSISQAFADCGLSCKRIFFGAPFIQIEPCETKGVLSRVASFSQFWIRQFGRFRILPFDRGLPYLSENRGFVGHKS